MARKTVDVAALKAEVNEMLASSTTSPNVRLGMCTVLENVLMSTGNYKGFGYLTADMMPNVNGLPGMHIDANGKVITDRETDDTRRYYY